MMGATIFTFELRFSEAPRKGFSYKTLRDNAFTVTGGEVVKARRLEKGKNVRWEISVRPDGRRPGDHRAARHHGLRRDRRRLHRRRQDAVQPPGLHRPGTGRLGSTVRLRATRMG